MTKIYAVAMQKGGVGKTTSVVNIAAFLARSGCRVLIVDMDPQANATSNFGYNKHEIEGSIYNLLLEETDYKQLVIHDPETKVDLLPASSALAGAEVELVNLMAREYRLRDGLASANGNFDYILIDCPPSLGLLTVNGLAA
ncbi:MAG: AAA family ATPase, partial [Candidatus Promineifilaceae bacterium]